MPVKEEKMSDLTAKEYVKGSSKKDFWNAYAPTFRKNPKRFGYEEKFMKLAQIEPGTTVFDMGCGPGTLAIPLAQKGCQVWACDFSEKMLEILQREAEEKGIADRIHTELMDWNEDWEPHNIPVCDVAISSRSMMGPDLAEGVAKLQSKSKGRVIVVTFTVETPHYNVKVAEAIGHKKADKPAAQLLVNLLFDQGLKPKVDYIDSQRIEYFDSYEDSVRKMAEDFFRGDLTEEQKEKLREYNRNHLITEEVKGETKYLYDAPWTVAWAFVDWNFK